MFMSRIGAIAANRRRLWTPSQISTALWLDAADASTITLNESTVSQWRDKSGNERNATQAIATDQPTYNATSLNGKAGITFDGLTDFMTVAHDNALNVQIAPSSVVLLFRWRSGFRTMQKGTGGGGLPDQFFHNNILSISGAFVTNYNPPVNAWTLDIGIWDNSLITYYQNGISFVPSTVSGGTITNGGLDPTATPAANTEPLFIGKRNNPSGTEGHLNGDMLELLIIKSVLSTSDRQRIEGYLAWKWGLVASLPADHPYKLLEPIV